MIDLYEFSESAQKMLKNRYLHQHETPTEMLYRVAKHYSDDDLHAERLYQYMSNFWFMPATPILSNGGTKRGLPISCFVNEISDTLDSIISGWSENAWLAAKGGGVGTLWSNIRPLGAEVENRGMSSGVIPFIVVQESISKAISQGSLRRGSSVAYLHVSHPEIVEFLDIRKPTGGDFTRKALEIHNAVVVNDAFMQAVEDNQEWKLINPRDHSIAETVQARDLWIRILTTRLETGEPYILFEDAANKGSAQSYKELGLKVKTSNLCSEIMLHTGEDYNKKIRTAVCCLSSVNLAKIDKWDNNENFIPDIVRFLDNVLSDFICLAEQSNNKYLLNAAYAARQERSIGLGVMGFHSMLQDKMIPFESAECRRINKEIFINLSQKVEIASAMIGADKGYAPDIILANKKNSLVSLKRNANCLAIAPTASISILCDNVSPSIEPFISNAFTRKTLDGSTPERNPALERLLREKGMDSDEIWSSIVTNEGSVQHLDFLSDHEKLVFKTAFEIDQSFIIELAADRTPFICQGQSLNIFLPANTTKKDLNQLHLLAWKKGLKSLYYCRSRSIQRAEKVSKYSGYKACSVENKECEACQ